MKIEELRKVVNRAARIYKKETGILPEIFDIGEDEDDISYLSIRFSRKVEREAGTYSGHSPHLIYSVSLLANQPNKFKWDGLKKWKAKQETK